jgi:hypothetical protein
MGTVDARLAARLERLAIALADVADLSEPTERAISERRELPADG